MSACRPLFKKYGSQDQSQDAYIEIDENLNITTYYSTEIGNAVPIRAWNEIDVRFKISSDFSESEIEKLIEKYREKLEYIIKNSTLDDYRQKRKISAELREHMLDLSFELENEFSEDQNFCGEVSCNYCEEGYEN